jgi:hypothetical protein
MRMWVKEPVEGSRKRNGHAKSMSSRSPINVETRTNVTSGQSTMRGAVGHGKERKIITAPVSVHSLLASNA